MDARSLFATLAIFFILWLIRTWVEWDIDARAARQSSALLRKRLRDTILKERVRPEVVNDAQAHTTDESRVSEPLVDDDARKISARKARLLAHIAELEVQARKSAQSDLELRRLRSELNSIPVGMGSATAALDALEARIDEQQSVIEQLANQSEGAPEHPELKTEDSGASEDMSTSISKSTPTPKAAKVDSESRPRTPLYEAPAHKDDLKRINGIGPVMERTLNELGVTTFSQLADFTQVDIDKVSEAIGAFPGRIERDDWVGKAREFVNKQSTA